MLSIIPLALLWVEIVFQVEEEEQTMFQMDVEEEGQRMKQIKRRCPQNSVECINCQNN